jgi:hypothetical protein
MKFVIYRDVKIKGEKTRKALAEWDQEKILKEVEKRLGEKGVSAFNEIIKEFKKETVTIP